MNMPGILKNKQFWGTIIAVILLAYCVKDVRTDDVVDLARRTSLSLILAALALQALTIVCKAIRWQTIVESSRKLTVWRVIPLFSAGQVLNIIMPMLTGQVGRILLFARKENLSKTYVFSTIIIEVLFDAVSLLLCIALLSTVTAVFPRQYQSISYIIALFTAALFALLYLMLHFRERIDDWGKHRLRQRWPGVYITFKKFTSSFTRGISMLRSTNYFSRTLLLSLLAWLVHALVIYFLFKAFGLKLPLISAVVIMVINTVALMVPITPGNAGTFELVVVAPLLVFGVSKTDAVLFALALHIVDLLPAFILGSIFIYTERQSLKEIRAEGEKEKFLQQVEDNLAVEEEKKV